MQGFASTQKPDYKANSSANNNQSDAKAPSTQDAAQKDTVNDGDEATCIQNGRKTYALIIGINNYGDVHHEYSLQGAVSDADKFENFVLGTLKVPKTNIVNLRDKDATRSSIINAFRILERIVPENDAIIIIYYAGHGAVADKPEDWNNWPAIDNKLEMLCPADMSLSESSGTERVEGIPDRTISRLLLDLSAAKGNNITLILDCCHSAGLNRSFSPAVRPRQIPSSQVKISPDCDLTIFSQEIPKPHSHDAKIKSGFSAFWDSHVLLAACGRRELAMEEDKGGVFTRALLNVLEKNAINELTYQSLMQHLVMQLKSKNQTPHWDGKYICRRIFGPPEEAADKLRVVCRRVSEDGRFVLMSGSLHGTMKDSEFEIYKTVLASDTQLLATASVTEVSTFHSYLTISLQPSQYTADLTTHGNDRPWYARLTKVAGTKAALMVYCDNPTFLDRILKACRAKLTVTIGVASTRDEASLLLKVEENLVSFKPNGRERDRLFGFLEDFPWNIPHTVPIGDISRVLQVIDQYAHFTYQLTRRNENQVIADFVSIEMVELGRVVGVSPLTPVCPDTVQQLHGITSDGRGKYIQINCASTGEASPKYGFTIRNVSKKFDNLYVYLLCFSASDLEIEVWFSSSMGLGGKGIPNAVDSRLGRDSPLNLGFGGPDMPPIAFQAVQDQNVDISFFHFFVTTYPVDLKSLERSSIEEYQMPRKVVRCEEHSEPPCEWASMTIPVIQRQRQPGAELDTPRTSIQLAATHTPETSNSTARFAELSIA